MIKKILTVLAVLLFLQEFVGAEEKKSLTPMLDKINSPQDIKVLSDKDLKILAKEIRHGILKRANTMGGHLGPDLGIVEATIALHYVFDSPRDKIIFDVSHQCYPHKMLTGRREAFTDPTNHPEISGYSNQDESEHDFFKMGHTSTSISLAAGMAKARDLKGENYNIIALIGDGSLSGGEALEGLNNAAVLNSNFIIVVNDNEMSIAPPNGGLYKALEDLRKTKGKSDNNMFKALGYEYYYLEQGNEIKSLIDIFEKVKDTQKPVVVHIHTTKGLGYFSAQVDKEDYHWILPNRLKSNKITLCSDDYGTLTAEYLLNAKKAGEPVVAVTPATPAATGFSRAFRKKMKKNYVDVDIAEQHAVGFVSGLAKNGAKPVLAVCSSFIQRAYDQLSQDFALNNAPATILVFNDGISAMDMTHLGIFDIPLIINIPNIVYLAPTSKEEYLKMLDWSVNQKDYPIVIRIPSGKTVSTGIADQTDYSVLNKYKIAIRGEKVAIIGAGSFFGLALDLYKELSDELCINATVINPIYLSGFDIETLDWIKQNHDVVITLEDGCIDGGFGEKISRYFSNSGVKVLNYGAKKEFTDRISIEELYKKYRLTKELITEDVKSSLNFGTSQ